MEAVGRDLGPSGHARGHVPQEHLGVLAVPLADQPGDHELRVGVDRGPRPDIAVAPLALLVGRHVALLGVDEAPDFVALDELGGYAPDVLIRPQLANRPQISQELDDRVLRSASHAAGSPDAVPLHEGSYHLDTAVTREPGS